MWYVHPIPFHNAEAEFFSRTDLFDCVLAPVKFDYLGVVEPWFLRQDGFDKEFEIAQVVGNGATDGGDGFLTFVLGLVWLRR